jgi:hypothetical protein
MRRSRVATLAATLAVTAGAGGFLALSRRAGRDGLADPAVQATWTPKAQEVRGQPAL